MGFHPCVIVFHPHEGQWFFFFFLAAQACGSLVPSPGIESGPRQEKLTVLTTGPPGTPKDSCSDHQISGSPFLGEAAACCLWTVARLSCRAVLVASSQEEEVRAARGAWGTSSFLPACPWSLTSHGGCEFRSHIKALYVSPSSAHGSPAPNYSPGIPSALAPACLCSCGEGWASLSPCFISKDLPWEKGHSGSSRRSRRS